MPIRQLEAEKNALKIYGQKYGKMPETPEEWSQLHTIAYPTINDLPDELKNETTLSYYLGTDSTQPSSIETPQAATGSAQARMEKARQEAEGSMFSNEAMRVFQDALRKRVGPGKTELGTSKIFEEAGVTGLGALTQSLNTRANEIATNATDFRNAITGMSGIYKDMANKNMFQYEAAAQEYYDLLDREREIEDRMAQQAFQIEMMQMQHDLDREMASYRAGLSGSGGGDDDDSIQGNMKKVAKRLAELRDKGELTDLNYDKEIEQLMLLYDAPIEEKGRWESDINNLMAGGIPGAEQSAESMANEVITGGVRTESYKEQGLGTFGTGEGLEGLKNYGKAYWDTLTLVDQYKYAPKSIVKQGWAAVKKYLFG
uniref:Uncharacterized protein n=1 Tax=viral metagenome TaxID=1070528 RepID=A0A6M3IK60_9ZZZZ